MLEVLTCGENFDQDISNVCWPQSLRIVTFYGYFNRDISTLLKLPALYQLELGYRFDQDISNLSWPQSLHILTLGSINKIKLPETLHTFSFNMWYDEVLDDIQFPLSLLIIDFGYSFNQIIDCVNWYQYELLSIIKFGSNFKRNINNVKFHSISTIYDDAHRITLKSCTFPKSLHKIIHCIDYTYVTVYERQIGGYTKSARRI
jgi:hypothetical protein